MKHRPCPRCHTALQIRRKDGVIDYECTGCDGRAATLLALKKRVPGAGVGVMWAAVLEGAGESELNCPSCSKGMLQVVLTKEQLGGAGVISGHGRRPTENLELDVCRPCSLVWFDQGERTALGADPSSAAVPVRGLRAPPPVQLPNMNTGTIQTARQGGSEALAKEESRPVMSARKLSAEPEEKGGWSWAAVKSALGIG